MFSLKNLKWSDYDDFPHPWFFAQNRPKIIIDFIAQSEQTQFELQEKHKIFENGPP